MLAAYYMGIPVKWVVSLIWAISAMVAACAGVLLAPITFVHSNVGLVLGLKAFPAAVLGGFGSIPGALVGGLLIGVSVCGQRRRVVWICGRGVCGGRIWIVSGL